MLPLNIIIWGPYVTIKHHYMGTITITHNHIWGVQWHLHI